MLKLTRKADYGLIALRHLARNREGASAKEIAAVYGIPTPLLAKVLQKLARNGLLTAAYGTNGGYRLARLPDSISALEVIRAIDGGKALAKAQNGEDPAGKKRGDLYTATINGKVRTIQLVAPTFVGGNLVRVEMTVRG